MVANAFMDPEATVLSYFGIQPGMKIADFGAGAGFFAILMAKLTGERGSVTAVDVLDSALDAIRAKAKSEALNNIATVRSNLEVVGSSGLADGSQDLVLVKNVLFQSQKKAEIFREAGRVLAPGGQLVVLDWKKGSGGLGPPDQLRDEPEQIVALAQQYNFNLANSFTPDAFHFGLILKHA